MENEKLQLGNALQNKIKTVKDTLKFWQGATNFWDDSINVYWSCMFFRQSDPEGYMSHNNSHLKVSPETFTIVKALNVTYWQQELDRLEKEFNEL